MHSRSGEPMPRRNGRQIWCDSLPFISLPAMIDRRFPCCDDDWRDRTQPDRRAVSRRARAGHRRECFDISLMRPTISRLPPLNALRAFVVAAKHLSFSRAANELHVTPAAVSQQIKLLEDQLGCTLFRRGSRSLMLTDEGQACLPGLVDAFDGILAALDQIGSVGQTGALT